MAAGVSNTGCQSTGTPLNPHPHFQENFLRVHQRQMHLTEEVFYKCYSALLLLIAFESMVDSQGSLCR